MISPLLFAGEMYSETYDPDETAMFEAYLDIQDDIDHEDFALPYDEAVKQFLSDELFKN